ncbi:MAG: caspase family protein [Rubrivivax sp.]|nr:caspase family protein [Rubrivivax sp.]
MASRLTRWIAIGGAVIMAAGAGPGVQAQGAGEGLAACQAAGAPSPACRDALSAAGGDAVLAVVERWVQARRYADAREALEQLRRREPWNRRAQQQLHEVASLDDEAAWAARRAAASASAPELELTLAETRCTRLSGEQALAACDQVLAARPQDVRMQTARGDLLLTLGRPAQALAAYRAAATREPAAALQQKIAIAEAAARPAGPAVAAAPRADATPSLDAAAFGRYHALVIGIDAYRHLDRLKTAVHDARTIGTLLRSTYGFEVRLLAEASRADIVEALDDYRNRLEPQDNLLIYYAGHGWLDTEADKGFWLPADAHPDKRTQWVSNDTVRDALRALKAKHVLVVADSCFSGTLTRGATAAGAQRGRDYLERMARLKARQVLTSGGLEPVADSSGSGHSPFAAALIQTLTANRGVLDATSLFGELRRPVALNSEQVPQFADIRLVGHQGGDFLFVRHERH